MNEEIVEELRELGSKIMPWVGRVNHTTPIHSAHGECLRCSLYEFALRVKQVADRLEAQSKPVPETPEAETARLSLEFAKWAGLPVVCTRHADDDGSISATHSTSGHRFQAGFGSRCINPHINEPLTVDVVLDVLAKEGLYGWTVGPTALVVGHAFVARKPNGAATYGDTPILALLRALDAADVMKKENERCAQK